MSRKIRRKRNKSQLAVMTVRAAIIMENCKLVQVLTSTRMAWEDTLTKTAVKKID